eukprot:17767-Rhodomonas_salina.1
MTHCLRPGRQRLHPGGAGDSCLPCVRICVPGPEQGERVGGFWGGGRGGRGAFCRRSGRRGGLGGVGWLDRACRTGVVVGFAIGGVAAQMKVCKATQRVWPSAQPCHFSSLSFNPPARNSIDVSLFRC